MTPESDKLIITKSLTYKIESVSELDQIIYDLITKNSTGQVTLNLSQGGLGPVTVSEKLKPPI